MHSGVKKQAYSKEIDGADAVKENVEIIVCILL